MMVKAFFAEAMTGWRSRAKHYMGPNVYTAPPDGGWGWVVAVSFFLVEVFTYGFIKSFGIFLHDLMQEFGESNSRVSWIISICVFVMTFTAPLASLLTSRFGFRPVVMVGGLLISIGSIASGFTSSINQMYITMGLIGGDRCTRVSVKNRCPLTVDRCVAGLYTVGGVTGNNVQQNR